jgi:hypothetical protein
VPVAAEKVPVEAEKVPVGAEKVQMQDCYKKNKVIYKEKDDEMCLEGHNCDNEDSMEHLEENIRMKKEHFERDERNYQNLKE